MLRHLPLNLSQQYFLFDIILIIGFLENFRPALLVDIKSDI